MNDMVNTGLSVGPTFSLVPQDLGQAMKLSELIANSDLAPKDYRGKPGNVLIAVQMGMEVGLSPMAAIQNIAVINGKPGLYGDAGKALLLARGFVIEEDDVEVIRKSGTARCKITRPGHPPCERTFSLEAAKTAGLLGKAGPWTNYKERQMAWRAFWFAARDIASDVLKGLNGAEEVADITERDVTPSRAALTTATGKKESTLPDYTAEQFEKNFPAWKGLIEAGKKTAEQIISNVSKKAVLSDDQKKQIEAVNKLDADEVTFKQVSDKLEGAQEIDTLDVAADFIKEVQDPAQRDQLGTLYQELRKKFEQ